MTRNSAGCNADLQPSVAAHSPLEGRPAITNDEVDDFAELIEQWELEVLDDLSSRHATALERARAERLTHAPDRRRAAVQAHIERRRGAGGRPRRVNRPRTAPPAAQDREPADNTPQRPTAPADTQATWAPTGPPPERRSEFDSRWYDPPGWLRGINLRTWIVLQLADSPTTLTIAELVTRLEASAWTVPGRLSKVISDALRCEVRRGRARRIARGIYAVGAIARTTKHRMRRRLQAATNRRTPAAPAPSYQPDPTVEVRNTLDFLFTKPVVARTRNATHTPTPDSTRTGRTARARGPGQRSPTVVEADKREDPSSR